MTDSRQRGKVDKSPTCTYLADATRAEPAIIARGAGGVQVLEMGPFRGARNGPRGPFSAYLAGIVMMLSPSLVPWMSPCDFIRGAAPAWIGIEMALLAPPWVTNTFR